MVEKLQSKTRDIRSGGAIGRSAFSAYAVAFISKLHSGISSHDSPGLFSQISMAMEMALAPKDWAPILLLAFICTTNIKHLDMKLSWIAEGVFSESLGYCEAEGDKLLADQLRDLERKVINLHKQERAKAVALVAKHPHLHGKNR
jgi:hypothetical protein